ncbi:hypothetical protein CDL15_Pgr026927 [Punica granatum]|uniref:7-deoxyloganetin glucosyltransferase-like n=1 Tax=Punica granatum TaxID=22663 RepID=A0A218XYG1_PUNGR|nr:hypothetical protein CDL15_Pgr026927 [Punica granatum]
MSHTCRSVMSLTRAPFCDLIEGLKKRAVLDPNSPAVSCILLDGFMTFSTGPASEKLGIPVVNLWTVPACVVMCLMQYSISWKRALIPLEWTSCRFVCTECGCGLEIGHYVKRDEVEKLVKELMEREKGKEMRKKGMERRKLAEEATAPYGSLSQNLDRLVHHILSI